MLMAIVAWFEAWDYCRGCGDGGRGCRRVPPFYEVFVTLGVHRQGYLSDLCRSDIVRDGCNVDFIACDYTSHELGSNANICGHGCIEDGGRMVYD